MIASKLPCRILPLSLLTCLGLLGCAAEPPGLDLPDCALGSATYRITDVAMTRSANEVHRLSLDLDGDGETDNDLGAVYATLLGWGEDDSHQRNTEALQARIADDELDWQLVVRSCSDPSLSDYADVQLVQVGGTDGTAIDPPMADDAPAAGTLSDRLVTRGGLGAAPAAAFFDPLRAAPVDRRAVAGVAVDLGREGDRLVGILGFGYVGPVADAIAPGIAAYATTLDGVREDFDDDRDGAVDPDEIATTSLLETMAGTPYLDLLSEHDGVQVYWPDHDAVRDSVSFALEITAEPISSSRDPGTSR